MRARFPVLKVPASKPSILAAEKSPPVAGPARGPRGTACIELSPVPMHERESIFNMYLKRRDFYAKLQRQCSPPTKLHFHFEYHKHWMHIMTGYSKHSI